MAEDETELTMSGPRSTTEIRRDIQRTRADLDATVDALGERLQPRRLLWEARRRLQPEVREATRAVVGKARERRTALLAGAGAVVGALLLRGLARRRRRARAAFPGEQKGL